MDYSKLLKNYSRLRFILTKYIDVVDFYEYELNHINLRRREQIILNDLNKIIDNETFIEICQIIDFCIVKKSYFKYANSKYILKDLISFKTKKQMLKYLYNISGPDFENIFIDIDHFIGRLEYKILKNSL